MKPEAKAMELVKRFFDLVDYNRCTSMAWGVETAKECATVAVDEIMKCITTDYWPKVKDAIKTIDTCTV